MPNTLITPTTIARRALATLYNTAVLIPLVYRDFDEDFSGQQGATVMIRTPAVFTAQTFNRATGIVVQDAKEGSTPVVLEKIADVSFAVTAEELTYSLEDFSTQLLNPALEAIVQMVDSDLAVELLASAVVGSDEPKTIVTGVAATDIITVTNHGLRNGDKIRFPALTGGAGLTAASVVYFVIAATTDTFQVAATLGGAAINFTTDITAGTVILAGGGTVVSAGATANANALIDARTILTASKLPQTDRFGALSPEQAGALLKDPLMRDADKRGDTDGLIDAALGRKFGIDNYETQAYSGLTANGVVFHRQAVALASRTLSLPLDKGADAAVSSYKGLGIRVVRAYDIDKKQDVVSLDFLYGVKRLRPYGSVALTLV